VSAARAERHRRAVKKVERMAAANPTIASAPPAVRAQLIRQAERARDGR
jgi:hypothetical protein